MTACRVTREPAVSSRIDSGPSAQSRATRRSRVSSPRAAKSRAELLRGSAIRRIPGDQDHLMAPACLIRRERGGAPFERNPIETGLG